MIVTIEEVKSILKIDSDDDDDFLNILIPAAENYLFNASDIVFDSTNPLAKLYCLCLIDDWHKNRSYTYLDKASEKVRVTLTSILLQLRYTIPPVVGEV